MTVLSRSIVCKIMAACPRQPVAESLVPGLEILEAEHRLARGGLIREYGLLERSEVAREIGAGIQYHDSRARLKVIDQALAESAFLRRQSQHVQRIPVRGEPLACIAQRERVLQMAVADGQHL